MLRVAPPSEESRFHRVRDQALQLGRDAGKHHDRGAGGRVEAPGDVDRDGKKDILTVKGWWRQVDLARDRWEWMPEWDFQDLAGFEIVAHDVNEDGLVDIIYGHGHSYGLYWLEQRREGGKRTWTKHAIDESYSQIHNVKPFSPWSAEPTADQDIDIGVELAVAAMDAVGVRAALVNSSSAIVSRYYERHPERFGGVPFLTTDAHIDDLGSYFQAIGATPGVVGVRFLFAPASDLAQIDSLRSALPELADLLALSTEHLADRACDAYFAAAEAAGMPAGFRGPAGSARGFGSHAPSPYRQAAATAGGNPG